MAEIQRAEISLEEQLRKTPSGLRLPCREISEWHLGSLCQVLQAVLGHTNDGLWTYQMSGSRSVYKLAWKAQAERSKIHGSAGDESEYKGLGDGVSDGDSGMSEDISILEEGQMENLATEADYHESCRLLYATPSAENALVWAEVIDYVRTYK
jgi:hypothetical protein